MIMKKDYILIGLILSIILISGCIQQSPSQQQQLSEKVPADVQQPAEEQSQQPAEKVPAKFELAIDIPKTSFFVGEKIEGKYIVENKDSIFRGYVLGNCKEEGSKRRCWGRSIAYLGKSSMGLHACGLGSCVQKSFTSPGNYIFELAVYDCAKIEEVLGVACSDADEDDVATQVSPISSTKKTVMVIGEAIIPECKTNEDCTQVVSCIRGHAPRQSKVVGGDKAVEAVFSREHCSIC